MCMNAVMGMRSCQWHVQAWRATVHGRAELGGSVSASKQVMPCALHHRRGNACSGENAPEGTSCKPGSHSAYEYTYSAVFPCPVAGRVSAGCISIYFLLEKKSTWMTGLPPASLQTTIDGGSTLWDMPTE